MKKLILTVIMVIGGLMGYASTVQETQQEDRQLMPGAMFAKNRKSKLKIFLPLKRTDVKLWVSAGIVHADVSQQFTNTTDQPLEAIYIFPLPSNSTVTNMVLKMGDRIIKSIVKEKQEAKKIYEQAKIEGKKTALIEQERPNIFTTSVANFLPGETVEIKLSYIEPIEYSKGCYNINFPMVVAPRYIPFKINVEKDGDAIIENEVADANRISPPLLHPSVNSEHHLTMSVDIDGLPLNEIISNTHAISVKEVKNGKTTSYNITLQEKETIPDSDFNLKLMLKTSEQPQISHLNSLNGKRVFSMINIFPPISAREKIKAKEATMMTPKEVVFLIDTSGSMSGDSIGEAKTGLKKCMKMLKRNDLFTIVRFSDTFSSFTPTLRKATPGRLEAAKNYIDCITAEGGTEMQQALQYVLNLKSLNPESMQLIVFLTDGDVGNEDTLIRLISNKLGKRRLFTFGIGSAPNEYLMRKMAELGRGQSRFIRSHEDIGTVMSDFFKTLEAPVLTDISLQWLDSNGDKINDVIAFPSPCPDVFNERPLQLFVSYPEGAVKKLIITGERSGTTQHFEYDMQDSTQSYPSIEKFFAKSAINQLMYKLIMNPGSEDSIKKDILKIALQHQLVTKYTSRVAVEERVVKQPNGSLLTVKVPVKLPKGFNSNAFFATASNDPLMFLLGSLAIALGTGIMLVLQKKWIRPPL